MGLLDGNYIGSRYNGYTGTGVTGGWYDYREQIMRMNAIAIDNTKTDDCGQQEQKNISATPNKHNSKLLLLEDL